MHSLSLLSRRLLGCSLIICLPHAYAFNPAPDPGPGPAPDPDPAPEIQACLSAPIGFAAQGGGTTGGAGGSVVTVRNGRELSSALDEHAAAWQRNRNHRTVIRIDGTINAGNSSVTRFDIKDTANLSLIGTGRGVLDGRGILIRGSSNIIVRNLTIRYVRDGSGDGIDIDGTRPVRNVWIDHNTFHNRLNVDKDYFDGLVDGKLDVSNITLSYNVFRDSHKTSLWGHSDNDSGNTDRRVTFAFNQFSNTASRTPLLRFGQTHIYNNYFNQVTDTGINTRMGNRVRIENNVFENSKNPIVSCYSRELGFWDARDNQLNNVSWQNSSDCAVAGSGNTATISYNPPYNATLLPTSAVKAHVQSNAGAGRCAL